MGRASFLLLSLSLLSACAWKVDVPISRFETPESTGKPLRSHLEGAFGSSSSVVLTDNFASTPPNTASPTFGTAKAIWVGAGIGVTRRLDVTLKTIPAIATKLQLLGPPRMTAQGGDFSVALSGSVLGFLSSSSAIPLGGPFSQVVADMRHLSLDGAVIAGMRFTRWVLLYGSGFARRTWYRGTYQATDRASGVTTNTPAEGSIDTLGGTLGFEVGPPALRGLVEGAFGWTRSGTLDAKIFYLGVAGASHFDLL